MYKQFCDKCQTEISPRKSSSFSDKELSVDVKVTRKKDRLGVDLCRECVKEIMNK